MKRAFILGIDGLPYTLARRLIDQGRMPSLAALTRRGTLAQMQSTVPDCSCTAWTSFATGVNPGKHGIFGLQDFHAKDGGIYRPTAADSLASPLWHAVDNAGGRSAVLNVPGNYPVLPLQGNSSTDLVVSDFDKANYPANFAQSLRGLGYQMDVDGHAGIPGAETVHNLLVPIFAARKSAIRHIIANETWDLGIAVITETVKLQHFYLAALDDVAPDHPGMRQFFIELDAFIGEIAAMLEGKAELYLVSDHGFAVAKRTIWLDDVLRLQGLAPPSPVRCWESPESAQQSHVFCLDPGRFYVNRKNGRFPHGRVADHEVIGVVEELKHILAGFRAPDTGEPVMEVIRTRNEGFWGPAADLAPDLVVAARAGYRLGSFRPKESSLPNRINWEGNPTWNDALIYVPGAIAPGIQPVIWDVLPTVLSGMGVACPENVDGRDLRHNAAPATAAIAPLPLSFAGQQGQAEKTASTKKPWILKGVASEAEMTTLSAWAMSAYQSGILKKNQTDFRNFNFYSRLPRCEVFEVVHARIAERIGLTEFPPDQMYENFLSVIFPGGYVQPHVDGAQPDSYHVRATLICQKPDSGGTPIIEGIRYEIAPGDIWVFLASETMHWTDMVQGSKPRIICSFGWAAPKAWWHSRID